MKSLLLSLFILGSSAAYAQSYSCNKSIGYSCKEDFFLSGKFTREALCFAYGEEIISIDEAEEAKIFSSLDSCEDISVTETDCKISSSPNEKFCAETNGEFLSFDSSCLRCNN